MGQPAEQPKTGGWKWWRGLNRYHWFVFAMASLAWLFDCLDQQLFLISRADALKDLLGKDASMSTINEYGGYATSIFMLGWATGGLIFGSLGDRIGRARTLTVTVFLYSFCTGLSALSSGWADFAFFRFLTGLGVGGVFGLAVALVADSLPAASRTGALGMLQALSAVGNIMAGMIGMLIGYLTANGVISPEKTLAGWRIMFLVGALPAFLCVFLQIKLKEPEAWIKARQEGRATGVKFGSYAALLSDSRWKKNALLGMLLCVAGVIGIWGIGFFSPELVKPVIKRNLEAAGLPPSQVAGTAQWWVSINMISQNTGAFFGMLSFTAAAQWIGRRKAFAIAFVAASIATIVFFQRFDRIEDIWMSSIMGFCQMSVFAGFAIYLPELFPLRLRSTGVSFCYNVGRFVAATGPFTIGSLQKYLASTAKTPDEAIQAFRNAASFMTAIFLVGLIAIYFLPETKGKPLPE